MKLINNYTNQITPKDIQKLSYVELMALLRESNKPPGGKDSVRELVQNCFLTSRNKVLDIGCNTGYITFEIARLAKCHIDGIDINQNMIKVANSQRIKNQGSGKTKFYVADVTNLPFKNQSYDTVVCGGSMAFVTNKLTALKEIKRVLRNWGFFADINFFYKSPPPSSILDKLNKTLEVTILPWNLFYWTDLYRRSGFEIFRIIQGNINQVTKNEIEQYCNILIKELNLSVESKKTILKKLLKIMKLFNINHHFLAYGIFILRKRPIKEQVNIFGA